MNLAQFSSQLITTAAEGKSLMNIINGMSPSGPNVLDALIALYESFPDNVKNNNKAFAPTFGHILNKYEMLEKHLPYYEKFSPLWGPAELAATKKKYAELLKDDKKQTFKNSLEFAKALSSINRNGTSKQSDFEFIDNHKDVIEPIIKKNKVKFIENLSKHHCWEALIQTDYNRFKSTCIELTIDPIAVLKREYASSESFYGFKYVIERMEDTSLIHLFKDIKDEPNFFEESSFFTNRDKMENNHQFNVLEISISLLSKGKHNCFHYLVTTYAKEIEECMKRYFYQKDYAEIDVHKSKSWIIVLDGIVEKSKNYGSTEGFHEFEASSIASKAKDNFKMVDVIILAKSLSEKEEETKTRKIKI